MGILFLPLLIVCSISMAATNLGQDKTLLAPGINLFALVGFNRKNAISVVNGMVVELSWYKNK